MSRDIEINVPDEDIAELKRLGFWKETEDGVLELTPEGNAWVLDWCKKRIAEHGKV